MTRIAQRPHTHGRRLWVAAWLACVLTVSTDAAYGQAPPPCERAVLTLAEAANLLRIDADAIARLAEQKGLPARRIGSSWRFSCAALMAWLNGDGKMSPDVPTPLTTQHMSEVSAAGTAVGQAGTTPQAGPPRADGQDKPVGEAPEERPAEDIFMRGQRVLLGRGEVVVDVGQFYFRSDDQVLAAVAGGVGLATVKQETFTALLQARLGILNETELFASTTFLSQDYDQLIGSANVASNSRSEFGGVNIGVRRTLLREGSRRPDVIVVLNGHIPTGATPYAAGGGLVLVKSVDPVALFVSANYLRAFRRDSSDRPGFWPRDRFDVSMGYGLALNDTLAVSMAVSGLFTGTRTLDDASLRQPDIFTARLALTSWLARGLYIEPSVSFGLTGPGRSFAFGLTLPYAF